MGRTVIVTGGGTGIGKAIAARFDGDGDTVIITGRRRTVLDATAAELGERVHAAPFDASDATQVESFAAQVEGIDVLVNNAGGNTGFDRDEPSTLHEVADAWRSNLEANVLSAVLTTTAVQPKIRDGGSIITIGSIAADKGAGSYGAAKAALASWNVDLARIVGPSITANVVSPGYIEDTEFFRDNLDGMRRASLVDAAITKRAGTPEDIANMVAFLAAPASRQITGQTFAVNGGEWTTR